jgi:hypothetical protein
LQAGEPDRDGQFQRICAMSIAFQLEGLQRFGKRSDNMVNGLASHRVEQNVRRRTTCGILHKPIDVCGGGRPMCFVLAIER